MVEFGSLDAWVNNVGIFPTTGPAIDATDDSIGTILRVNVRGTFAERVRRLAA